ncbi:hypothetical protein AC578_3487 [Pseudocercospora eumusae]|uniref:NADH dehydrogenase [ubiquinone] 1 alpha subcomplex subunit n=1 Tax=Pseudocercospora eumusae TaxID=321146 RepID=A0A139HR45_9PEZI|nr:hypothetical protein AC578_3487 [Pseudocercospora eumusae]
MILRSHSKRHPEAHPPLALPLIRKTTSATMSTIMRTLRNLRSIGLKEYGHQLHRGALVGIDRYGNKYFENLEEELPLRTRWVDYKDHEFDPSSPDGEIQCKVRSHGGKRCSQLDHRHAWISYMVDKSPAEDTLLQRQIRPWEPKKHVPVLTASRSAFKTFNTTKNKVQPWTPQAAAR